MSDSALSVEGLRKTYGRGDKRLVAVDDVSFSVRPGEVVGLLGPNGAGKTTLIKCILRLVEPDAGTVRMLGHDVSRRRNDIYRLAAAVLEGARNTYWRMTVRENLAFFAGLQGIVPRTRRAFHDELIERFGLTDKANTPVNQLSTGMKQKVAVACAFARETPILFLDEPTLGLDLHASFTLRGELKQLAADHQRTILLSSHDMEVVRDLCDRVIIVQGGRIVVDDQIANLLMLFRAQAYTVRVGGEVRDDLRALLEEEYVTSGWKNESGETQFDVTLGDSDELYSIIDQLRSAGLSLIGVTRSEPDLAQVFLRVTQGELAKEAAQ